MHPTSTPDDSEKEAEIAAIEAINAQLFDDYCTLTDRVVEEMQALKDAVVQERQMNASHIFDTAPRHILVRKDRGAILARISALYQIFELLNQPRPRFILGETYYP